MDISCMHSRPHKYDLSGVWVNNINIMAIVLTQVFRYGSWPGALQITSSVQNQEAGLSNLNNNLR
jgi:hypothetical protein